MSFSIILLRYVYFLGDSFSCRWRLRRRLIESMCEGLGLRSSFSPFNTFLTVNSYDSAPRFAFRFVLDMIDDFANASCVAFPEAWELEARFAATSTTVTTGEGDTMGEGSGDEGEEEEEEGEPPPPPPPPPIPQPSAQLDSPPPSAAYLSFLHFIERGCAGAPVQGYPAVLVVFATVPLSVRVSPPFLFSLCVRRI